MAARVAVISLGCDKNTVDAENMLGLLAEAGYVAVDDPGAADVVLVHTCGFIESAQRESIEALLQVARVKEANPRLKLIATGCLAQKWGRELLEEMPELDGVLGTGALAQVVSGVEEVLAGRRLHRRPPPGTAEPLPVARRRLGGGVSASLKIAEGCDSRCSYCLIPELRGPYRSRPRDELVREAANLVEQGVREIVLVAQDVTAYGSDRGEADGLARLVEALSRLEGLAWVRLLYCHPARLSEELLRVLAGTPRVAPYLDLPVQHASARVLRRMGRGGRATVERALERVQHLWPQAALRTTFMVGFPGEEERDFQELLAFQERWQFHWAGAFVYSAQEGTPAAGLPGAVPPETQEERYHRLMLAQREITLRKNAEWLGRVVPVLIEKKRGRYWQGRTGWQGPEDGVTLVRGRGLSPGALVAVRVTGIDEYDITGERVTE